MTSPRNLPSIPSRVAYACCRVLQESDAAANWTREAMFSRSLMVKCEFEFPDQKEENGFLKGTWTGTELAAFMAWNELAGDLEVMSAIKKKYPSALTTTEKLTKKEDSR